ncbi:ergothioneine biosynthesis protein EgtB [Qipengyuania sediminis]|uniref:ergothioneine biosynthesis protein EgtB n=1 Tax=Qipengyuania sediminis TaxID=1532023 RepID=UPI00105957BD|nr:ergothioneine biosynthesis protein EgtB [Qipengyuania sediminis]
MAPGQARANEQGGDIRERLASVRALTEALAAPLSDADATLQSMEDASPAKWHLAHTTWFWETFVLRQHAPGYRLFDARWPFLHNSYYEAEGARIARFARGLLSRPSLADVLAYRAYVTEAMMALAGDPALNGLIALGIAHEQQHQELLLTDIKHALWSNPLGPGMWELANQREEGPSPRADLGWHTFPGGMARIGHEGPGFAFDNEAPLHRVLLEPFALAKRLVTNGEWADFIAAGAYSEPQLWLSDGWSWVQREGVKAPLYWRGEEAFTHAGWQPRYADAPVTHISYYEAEAFAAWAGARLPSEYEWEAIAQGAHDASGGNQLDAAGPVLPRGGTALFGDCWQHTRSAYLPYPRFRPAAGAVGEYNGKFMSGQMVLRGASCATPRGSSRTSYRNFFYPHQRWQFAGLRLAKDL